MKCKFLTGGITRSAFAVGLLIGAFSFQSCSDDLLTGQPSWLGNSIYEELQNQGNYTYTLRLIDDLGLTEQMSHTGSLTIFVADDATYDQWFKTNKWGVRSYDKLTTAQKKLLLNNQMISNAYLIELMSNVAATPPEKGLAMRRPTSASAFDSVYVMPYTKMSADQKAWDWYRANNKNIILFRDGAMGTSGITAPMIHFLPEFMKKNNFTSEDVRILSNGITSSTDAALIGNHQVVDRDITCKNGYIQKMNGVVEPFENMAQIVHEHANTRLWANLLDRFSAPYYDKAKTQEYNRLYNASVDSVFTLRYFTPDARQLPVTSGNTSPGNVASDATLNFDPGWNQYMYTNTSGKDLHYDAGVMFVPTDKVLSEWWNNGEGKMLKERYGTWDKVPDNILASLINVNLVGSFVDAIPSKFSSIVNDAKEEMGVTTADVDSAFIGCNGVVYLTNKVFTPMEYYSVGFPAKNNSETMSVINYAINEYDFKPYLNSMAAKGKENEYLHYSLILPENNALLYYVDPATYGERQETVILFEWDTLSKTVKAMRYNCEIDDDGQIVLGDKVQANVPDAVIKNRLTDLVNNLIIVGPISSSYSYYKTKGGSLIKVTNADKDNMTVAGGWQLEHHAAIPVTSIYDLSQRGNGKSYAVNSMSPLTAASSVYQTLSRHEEYSEFLKLLQGPDESLGNDAILANTMKMSGTNYTCAGQSNGNFNINLFNNFNYTVYVPSNASIEKLTAEGILPTWAEYDEYYKKGEDGDKNAAATAQAIKDRILGFVRYHIQDNSLIIGGNPTNYEEVTDAHGAVSHVPVTTSSYETMQLDADNDVYYPLNVTNKNNQITITDKAGNVRHVEKTAGLYNNICREYWFSGAGLTKSIYSSSDAVVHLIDGPLFYSKSAMTPWKSLAKKYIQHRRK